jgi:putative lipoprotein
MVAARPFDDHLGHILTHRRRRWAHIGRIKAHAQIPEFRMRLAFLALAGLLLAGCMSFSEPRTAEVTGRVLYLERTALPRPGSLRVTLEDVSRADAPAIVVAEQTIDVVDGADPPFPFVLRVDNQRIRGGKTYVVRAEVRDAGGELRAVTVESYPVLTRGAPRAVDVAVRPLSATQASPPPPAPAPPRPAAPGGAVHGDVELRARGVDFRAIGQEPGWLLDMFRDRIELSYDYGDVEITAPRPPPILPAWQGEIYETQTATHRITITIRRTPCQDAMSGEMFPAQVTVLVNGRTLQGCGRST